MCQTPSTVLAATNTSVCGPHPKSLQRLGPHAARLPVCLRRQTRQAPATRQSGHQFGIGIPRQTMAWVARSIRCRCQTGQTLRRRPRTKQSCCSQQHTVSSEAVAIRVATFSLVGSAVGRHMEGCMSPLLHGGLGTKPTECNGHTPI